MSSIGNIQGISNVNIQSMDIETALMMVQGQRTQLLDNQLTSQIQEVQNRNNQISKLNDVLAGLNAAQAMFAGDAKPDAKLGDTQGWKDESVNGAYPTERSMNTAMLNADINLGLTSASDGALTNSKNADGSEVRVDGGIRGMTTKSQVDAAIAKVKGMIDSAGNSQQMDMLRLQSLTNKRNEAFDVMTNFVKKMQESRSSIIGNMR
jgi:hypothetical protein